MASGSSGTRSGSETDFLCHVAVVRSIGTGKSTFLQDFQDFWKRKMDLCFTCNPLTVYPEPVDEWKSYGKSGFNYWGRMYHDPVRYAFEFQIAATISKYKQIRNMTGICMVERTFACQKQIFVPMLYEFKDRQKDVIDDLLVTYTADPKYTPDLIVLLTCSDEVAAQRIARRRRPEERDVSIGYLKNIRIRYEKWVGSHKWGNYIEINTDAPITAQDYEHIFECISMKMLTIG
jgi:deoxyadenosine/deoxycytidine kinase